MEKIMFNYICGISIVALVLSYLVGIGYYINNMYLIIGSLVALLIVHTNRLWLILNNNYLETFVGMVSTEEGKTGQLYIYNMYEVSLDISIYSKGVVPLYVVENTTALLAITTIDGIYLTSALANSQYQFGAFYHELYHYKSNFIWVRYGWYCILMNLCPFTIGAMLHPTSLFWHIVLTIPMLLTLSIANTFVIYSDEHHADAFATRCGYGHELLAFLDVVSKEKPTNNRPSLTHPSIRTRIKYIQKVMNR